MGSAFIKLRKDVLIRLLQCLMSKMFIVFPLWHVLPLNVCKFRSKCKMRLTKTTVQLYFQISFSYSSLSRYKLCVPKYIFVLSIILTEVIWEPSVQQRVWNKLMLYKTRGYNIKVKKFSPFPFLDHLTFALTYTIPLLQINCNKAPKILCWLLYFEVRKNCHDQQTCQTLFTTTPKTSWWNTEVGTCLTNKCRNLIQEKYTDPGNALKLKSEIIKHIFKAYAYVLLFNCDFYWVCFRVEMLYGWLHRISPFPPHCPPTPSENPISISRFKGWWITHRSYKI